MMNSDVLIASCCCYLMDVALTVEDAKLVIMLLFKAGHVVADFVGTAYFNSNHSLVPPCSPWRAGVSGRVV